MSVVNKQPRNWTDEELFGWAKGEIEVGTNLTEEGLAAEVFKRTDIEQGTVEEAKAIVLRVNTDVVVEQQEVETVETTEEVIEEEILTPVLESVKETPVEPAKVETKNTPAVNVGTNLTLVGIKEFMENYVAKMTPGVSHNGNEGVQLQTKFYRTLQTVLRLKGSDFFKAYGLVLETANLHRNSVFHERFVFRYFDGLTIPNNDRRNFERLVHLIITTCNPATRSKTMKQVDIVGVMEGFNNEEMTQKVLGFYNDI